MSLSGKSLGFVATAAILVGLALPSAVVAAGLDDRDSEPAVLTGADTPLLTGAAPGKIVAFAWFGSWQQIPVQVDERKMIDYRPVRQSTFTAGNEFREMAYADPNTWVEADGVPQTVTNPSDRGAGAEIPGTAGDPLFDENDEVAFMASDAGNAATGKPAPAGVAASSRTPVRITDPLDPSASRYVYLFRAVDSLDPSAGSDYVSYQQSFSPALNGGYRLGYQYGSIGDNVNGPPSNPEDSEVVTSRYEIGIPARWMVDRLVIAAGDGETDILDGDKSTVSPNGCGRNELTFSRGGGGFIANIDGPVRAIRSFIGANSGTFTQREYVFYEGLWENRTFLRVHPGINQFVMAMDLSPEATGMTYRNQLNPAGVTVDGVQDNVTTGPFDWEQFSGDQGSVTNVARFASDIDGLNRSSYYQDMLTPASNSSMLCSGDDHSYGAAGPMLTTPTNNTDPTLAPNYPDLPVSHFSSVRYSWFDGPEADATLAGLRSEQIDNPLEVEAGSSVEPPPVPVKRPRLTVRVRPQSVTVRRGGRRAVRIVVGNVGKARADRVTLCLTSPRAFVRIGCRKIGTLGAGREVTRTVTIRPRRNSRPGVFRIRTRVSGQESAAVSRYLKARIRR